MIGKLRFGLRWQRPCEGSVLVWILVWMVFSLGAAKKEAIGSEYSDRVIADGAIHYWRFEETSTTEPAKDEISGVPGQANNPGTYAGSVTLGQPSMHDHLGSAARFGGGNDTHVALGTPQHPGDSFSVEAWIKLDANITTGFSPVIARWDGSYELDINSQSDGGALNLVVRNEANAFAKALSQPLARDTWYHVVGTFDAADGTARVFVNGEEGTSQTIGGVLRDAGGDDGLWYIGRTRSPNSGFHWEGLLDEVAIYNRPLSGAEAQAHYLLGIPEPASITLTGLGTVCLLWWRRAGRRRRN